MSAEHFRAAGGYQHGVASLYPDDGWLRLWVQFGHFLDVAERWQLTVLTCFECFELVVDPQVFVRCLEVVKFLLAADHVVPSRVLARVVDVGVRTADEQELLDWRLDELWERLGEELAPADLSHSGRQYDLVIERALAELQVGHHDRGSSRTDCIASLNSILSKPPLLITVRSTISLAFATLATRSFSLGTSRPRLLFDSSAIGFWNELRSANSHRSPSL